MSEPTVGLAQAAKMCNVSVSTMRRRKETLQQYGATVSDTGWVIPISSLVASGLMPSTTPPESAASGGRGTYHEPPAETGVEARIADLEKRLAEAERELAAERERSRQTVDKLLAAKDQVIETQRRVERLLGPAPEGEPAHDFIVPPAELKDAAPSKPRRWFKR